MEFQNNHEENYKQYLKQFHESQNDVISNQRRYDLGLSNQAITTGKMSVHKLQGGAMSSDDIYDYGQKLLKQRSDDLSEMNQSISRSKGRPARAQETDTLLLDYNKLIQKIILTVGSWNLSDKLFNQLLDLVSFLQQNGYKLSESDIVEIIDNLNDINQTFIDESGSRGSLEKDEVFIINASQYIIQKILILLNKLLANSNKSEKDRKFAQSSSNKLINFSKLISEVNSGLSKLYKATPSMKKRVAKSISEFSLMIKPEIRKLFPASVAEDDEADDDEEAGEGEIGTTAVGVVESKEMDPAIKPYTKPGQSFNVADTEGVLSYFPIDFDEFLKATLFDKSLPNYPDAKTQLGNNIIKKFGLPIKQIGPRVSKIETFEKYFKDIYDELLELSRR